MCVCINICIYVYLYVCTYVGMYVFMYICRYVFACTQTTTHRPQNTFRHLKAFNDGV